MAWLAISTGRYCQLLMILSCNLLTHVQALEITYPISSTVYPAKGPDKVQWTYDDADPSNVLIYLATFSGSKITNYLPCLNWTTSAGSVDIKMSQTAPIGQSWTWQFYDPTQSLQLGSGQIAESAHFTITDALLPESKKKGLSAGAAAAIGVIVTLLVVTAGLAAAWYFIYRPRQRRNQSRDEGLLSAPAKMFAGLHEVGGSQSGDLSNNAAPPADGGEGGTVGPPRRSQRALSSGSDSSGRVPHRPMDGNELPASLTGTYHEVTGQQQQHQTQAQALHNNELPASPQGPHGHSQREANELSGIHSPVPERAETRRKPVPVSREGSGESAPAKPVYEM